MKPLARKLKEDKFNFYPLSCIHWPVTEKGLLRRWVEQVDEDPHALALLLGDSFDFARTHYRKHLKAYIEDGNSQDAIDKWQRRDVEDLAKILKPIAPKLLGAILGNHHAVYTTGINSEQYLCELLRIPYLGPTGIIRVDMPRQSCVIYAHHDGGSRGSRTSGSDLSTLTRAEESFEADVYTLGHTHRCYGFKNPKLGVTKRGTPKVVERPKVFLRAGCLMKGYKDDAPTVSKPHMPSYAEVAAYRPTSLGWVVCEVRGKRRTIEGSLSKQDELDFKVIH